MDNFHSVAVIFTLLIFITGISKSPVTSVYTFITRYKHHECGYASCPEPKKDHINVHIVPHTHDDVGWTKTFNQYFYGSKDKTKIRSAGVRTIIDSVIGCLWENPERKFVYAETAYFWKWWLQQNVSTHRRVKKLVDEGRLEFVGGGWSAHDETVTHYQSIIDQMCLGFRRLYNMFGTCGRPRVGWQIDSIGHSRESASIMARLGFDGLFFGKLDFIDHDARKDEKRLEMVWEASPNLGSEADLFTSILYNQFNEPKEFCFDILCDDPEIVDDKQDMYYNADIKVKKFVKYVINMSRVYTSNNVLVTMGRHFSYKYATKNFNNLDRLIRAVNNLHKNNSKVNLFYSTPSCYLKAVNDEMLTYTVKDDDFLPYSTGKWIYWTGLYSSRPTLKYFERIGNNFLQICKQLFTISNLNKKELSKLNYMSEAMAILQNHEGLTGTSRQYVVNDYLIRLNKGFVECGDLTDAALRKLMVKDKRVGVDHGSSLKSCMYLNISSCPITENNNRFVVTVYNPLSRSVTKHIRLPIVGNGENYIIYDPSGNSVDFQILPIPEPVLKVPGRASEAKFELVFVAYNIPPLGFRSYYVHLGKQHRPNVSYQKRENLIYDNRTGAVTMTVGNVNITQFFYYYHSDPKTDNTEFKPSGAYIFYTFDYHLIVGTPEIKIYTGPIVDEVHLVYNEWISQVIRKYHIKNYLEFQWLIGPVPIDDTWGKEVMTKYLVKDMATNKTFYTDSNGREMLQRVRDKRPAGNIPMMERISGNHFPITTRIMMKDNNTQVSVITDRSQGGSSLTDGELQIMIHRRLVCDDYIGLNEALNETAFGSGLVVRGTHFVTAGNPINQNALDRMIIQERVLSAWSFFTPTTNTFQKWNRKHKMEYFGLKTALPPNVQILTLEPWSNYGYLIRLEHIMEKNDDPKLSEPVTLNLQDLFHPFQIISAKETTLGGNQWLSNLERLVWKKDVERTGSVKTSYIDILQKICLKPMEIRSFLVEVEHK